MFLCSDWLKQKVILVLVTLTTTSKVRVSRLALWGFQAHPFIDITLVYSHMLTHSTSVEIVIDVFLVLWLCLVPPFAKCRVCEDMQVARCLCNFPPAPFKRQAHCNNNKPVLFKKSNSAWLEFQRFFV